MHERKQAMTFVGFCAALFLGVFVGYNLRKGIEKE